MQRARNLLCKQSSTPETREQRRLRLDARRLDQREGRTANALRFKPDPYSPLDRIFTHDAHGMRVDRRGVLRSKSWKHVYGSHR